MLSFDGARLPCIDNEEFDTKSVTSKVAGAAQAFPLTTLSVEGTSMLHPDAFPRTTQRCPTALPPPCGPWAALRSNHERGRVGLQESHEGAGRSPSRRRQRGRLGGGSDHLPVHAVGSGRPHRLGRGARQPEDLDLAGSLEVARR